VKDDIKLCSMAEANIHTSAVETSADLVRTTTLVEIWLNTQHTIAVNLQRTQHRLVCHRRRPAEKAISITCNGGKKFTNKEL